MSVFFVLLLVPIMMQHIVIKEYRMDYQRRNRAAMAFFFVFLTLLIALRHENVGNDTRNYIRFFKAYSRVDWSELGGTGLEVGFQYLNKLISLLSENPQVFLAVVAVIGSAMIYPTYKRLCVDASLTIVLFSTMSTFVMLFSGIRQILAIGLGFIAYECTRKRQLIPFVALVILAMSFHTSAFILAFMYPLYHAKITKKSLLFVIPALVVCFIFNKQIFGILGLILEQYTKYDAEITATGAYTMLILFGIFVAFSFLIPDERKMDEELVGLRNLLLLAFVLQMFAPLHTLAMRMGYYYIIFIPLLLPKVIECRSRRWNQVAILGRHVMVIFFLLYFFISASGGSALNVFPYHFFWENI